MPPAAFLPAETIRRKRDGAALTADEIATFVRGLVDGDVSGEQAAAFAMATWFRGMTPAEVVALTFAMRDSGEVLEWGTATSCRCRSVRCSPPAAPSCR